MNVNIVLIDIHDNVYSIDGRHYSAIRQSLSDELGSDTNLDLININGCVSLCDKDRLLCTE